VQARQVVGKSTTMSDCRAAACRLVEVLRHARGLPLPHVATCSVYSAAGGRLGSTAIDPIVPCAVSVRCWYGCLSVCLFVCLSVHPLVADLTEPPVRLPSITVWLYVCLSVCPAAGGRPDRAAGPPAIHDSEHRQQWGNAQHAVYRVRDRRWWWMGMTDRQTAVYACSHAQVKAQHSLHSRCDCFSIASQSDGRWRRQSAKRVKLGTVMVGF
jgi:hypothetical protein